jgi:hypothetical protein
MRGSLRHVIGAVVLASATAGSLAAQQDRLSIELGLSALSLDGVRPTRSLMLIPSYGYEGTTGSLNLGAAVAMAPEGDWSAAGSASAMHYIAPSAFGRYEVGALIGGVAYGEDQRALTSLLQGRSVRGDARDGLWVGAGGGLRWDQGAARSVFSVDAGLWRSFAPLRVTAQLSVTRAYEDSLTWVSLPYPDAGSGSTGPLLGSVQMRRFHARAFGTAVLAGSWTGGPVTVDGVVSSRTSLEGGASRQTALGAITWRLDRRLAVVASGGRQQPDQMIGVPGGGFATLTLRLTASGAEPVRRTGEDRRVVSLLARRGGVHVLRLDIAGGADRVEIAGDFSSWEPVALVRRGGVWETPLDLAPGSYRIAIRVDGGEWVAPPGLPQVGDELGGVVGILVIP